MGRHTIVLLQPTQNRNTRTYSDFETVAAAMDGICSLFEQRLKVQNPRQSRITYDISDLHNFIDSLTDLSCLVYNDAINAYEPCNKDWIKSQLLNSLRRQANFS